MIGSRGEHPGAEGRKAASPRGARGRAGAWCALALMLVGAASGAWGGAPGGMMPIPVEVAPALRGPVRAVLPTVGSVHPLREVKVGSKIAERVARLLVDEGDAVNAGDVICELDTTDTRLKIEEMEAQVKQAQATLDKLVAGLRPNEIRQAEAALEEQQAKVKKLKQDSERAKQLFQKGVIADAERDAVFADYETGVARMHGAEAALALAKEGSRKEDIAQAEATVALRKAELAMDKQRLDDASIRSPVKGYVVRKQVEVGQWTQVGGTVAEVIDTSVLRVHTRVTEKTVKAIHEKQRVVLSLDAHPGSVFEGVVHRIIPQADPGSRSFPVQIDVTKPDGLVQAGMFARVSFVLSERANVLQVPEDAIVERGGLKMVFKAVPMLPPAEGAPGGLPQGAGGPPKGAGGPPPGMPPPAGPMYMALRTIVRTGVRQEGKIEIAEVTTGALDTGDFVVTAGNDNLRADQPVIVVRGLPAPPRPLSGIPPGELPAGAPPKATPPREAPRP